MDWLHQAQTARQNHARRSQMKKLLVLSGFLEQKFAGNLKEDGQIVPDSVRILLCLQKETECDVVWLNLASFLQFSCKLLVQEARQNQQLFYLARFCLVVWALVQPVHKKLNKMSRNVPISLIRKSNTFRTVWLFQFFIPWRSSAAVGPKVSSDFIKIWKSGWRQDKSKQKNTITENVFMLHVGM